MKKSRFTEEQIAYALKQAELGTTVGEICRKMGVAEGTVYVWRKKYGGLGPSELKRLRLLEEENRKLKQLVAGFTPILRTLLPRPILGQRSVHVEAKEVQCGVQARCG